MDHILNTNATNRATSSNPTNPATAPKPTNPITLRTRHVKPTYPIGNQNSMLSTNPHNQKCFLRTLDYYNNGFFIINKIALYSDYLWQLIITVLNNQVYIHFELHNLWIAQKYLII